MLKQLETVGDFTGTTGWQDPNFRLGASYILVAVAIAVVVFIIKEYRYRKTVYYNETGNNRLRVQRDKGLKGEYSVYKALESFSQDGRFLFNVYLPTDNERTTEIDVMLLSRRGIIVFESKNYAGWIFGSENSREWTQTLPKGRKGVEKSRFYNPIWQNKGHVQAVKKVIENVPIWSVVTFADKAVFKSVPQSTGSLFVVHYRDLARTVQRIPETEQVHADDVERMYQMLKPYANASEETKAKHVADIKAAKRH